MERQEIEKHCAVEKDRYRTDESPALESWQLDRVCTIQSPQSDDTYFLGC